MATMTGMGTHGQGSVVREQNGRYRIAVTMADGRRVYRRARDPKAAERIRKQLIEARELDLDPSRLTIAEWLRSWLASLRDARNQRVRPRTLDHYTLIVERHIIPALGARRLSELSERHVQKWIDADAGAARTVHHHRAVLRRALNVALRQRVVARNVAIAVELPDPGGFVGSPLTVAEARLLLRATAADRLHALWRLALDTGARQGELLGLGWDDYTDGTVRIHAQLLRRGGQWQRVPTKAARHAEVMTLMPETVAALDAHRVRQAAEREPSWRYWGHVFLAPDGEPYHGADVLRAFKAACRAAGIQERRFHDLRASCATLLRELGVPEDVRMARLGHATERMARHYARPRAGFDREAVRLMSEALAG